MAEQTTCPTCGSRVEQVISGAPLSYLRVDGQEFYCQCGDDTFEAGKDNLYSCTKCRRRYRGKD